MEEYQESYRVVTTECPECGYDIMLDEMNFEMVDDIQITDVICEECGHEFKAKHPDY